MLIPAVIQISDSWWNVNRVSPYRPITPTRPPIATKSVVMPAHLHLVRVDWVEAISGLAPRGYGASLIARAPENNLWQRPGSLL